MQKFNTKVLFSIMEIAFLKTTINFHHQLFLTHHIKLMTQVYSKYFLQEVRDNFFLLSYSRLQKVCSFLFFILWIYKIYIYIAQTANLPILLAVLLKLNWLSQVYFLNFFITRLKYFKTYGSVVETLRQWAYINIAT